MNEVTDALAPVEDGFSAENCFLFGPSGSGKTTVARASVRELRREVLDVPTGYVNCWKDYTRSAVLERAVKDLANTSVRRGAPVRDLLDELQSKLDSPSVIILDEVDQLRDTKLLYDLHTVRGLSWIAIANREVDLFAKLEDRVRSRIGVGYRVRFDHYNADIVTEILGRRAQSGLVDGAAERHVLRRIAESTDGDARKAITALRVAAKKAAGEGLSSIPERLVEESVVDAEAEIRQKSISKLNDHQHTVYQILKRDGPLIQKDLYERYQEEHGDDTLSYRSMRGTHLPKLEHYNLVAVSRGADGKLYRLTDSKRVEG
ncbi:Cdc6/Cdc18 family protein [Halobaculum rubrum]|uniref:Cdc6/Cdc18 family protein n=1 Tax=Halobaculum rubrum TaxID=2872158 RepID=UPI001EFF24A4|nr:Cdc6/Cdc18 family protein [Halobaculum rubrum]